MSDPEAWCNPDLPGTVFRDESAPFEDRDARYLDNGIKLIRILFIAQKVYYFLPIFRQVTLHESKTLSREIWRAEND